MTLSPAQVDIGMGALRQFSATVTGATDTSVIWSATGGTIDTYGQFTAGTTLGSYSVTATSVADPSKKATATGQVRAVIVQDVWIQPPYVPAPNSDLWVPGPNPLETTPFSPVAFPASLLMEGQGTGRLRWTCTAGSVSATETGGSATSSHAITYTAPAAFGTYTLTAMSVDDPTKFATWGVKVAQSSDLSIYRYEVGKGLTQPGESTTLTAWFSGSGVVDQGVGSLSYGVPKTVSPQVATRYQLNDLVTPYWYGIGPNASSLQIFIPGMFEGGRVVEARLSPGNHSLLKNDQSARQIVDHLLSQYPLFGEFQ